MKNHITITPPRTYATEATMFAAIQRWFPGLETTTIRFFTMRAEDGRVFPVFVGQEAARAGIHFKFNVLA